MLKFELSFSNKQHFALLTGGKFNPGNSAWSRLSVQAEEHIQRPAKRQTPFAFIPQGFTSFAVMVLPEAEHSGPLPARVCRRSADSGQAVIGKMQNIEHFWRNRRFGRSAF